MKTDDEVLEIATGIVENQWCQGSWKMAPAEAVFNGLAAETHYCAVGALQKAAGTRVQGSMETLEYELSHVDQRKVAQVRRIAERLVDVVTEQYPEWIETQDFCDASPLTDVVEEFNDDHTRDEMLTIFEKAQAK